MKSALIVVLSIATVFLGGLCIYQNRVIGQQQVIIQLLSYGYSN